MARRPTDPAMTLRDPVCAMIVPDGKVGAAVTHAGQVFTFCSEECMIIFEEHPEKYTPAGHERVVDPVCGKAFWRSQSIFHYEYKGNIYRFCGEECYDLFTLDPADYAETPEFA